MGFYPNEHQTQHQSSKPDAKSMFAAIKTRFGGNAATNKTQKTLLMQQYENFSATSAESFDSIFNRLQKIVSRLTILVVWMNKPEFKTMSIDNLYNNFKIVEQRVKKSIGISSGAQNLAFMTASKALAVHNDANIASPKNRTSSNQTLCANGVSTELRGLLHCSESVPKTAVHSATIPRQAQQDDKGYVD
ncbi:hypothetical protein Tco_0248319 [Tanacetum coccineum]